ncbi:MAG: 23S rRNA pseudouridine1911/1915/1917 synthase [Planctomycetota bacterium]|jgi:23S rRNA pseudouridine1911/1915/1917 synthase
MKVSVIKETPSYLIINKPAGLVVHGDGRTKEETLADWILGQYPEMGGVGEPWGSPEGEVIPRPGIVHRLDRDTSGVMVIARNQEMFEHLKVQFADGQIFKEYRAFVYGHPKEDQGSIDAPIGKSRRDFRMWSASRGARGKLRPAQTEYQVHRRFDDAEGNHYSYMSFFPKTGRTHQIRVHAKYMNYSIVGDKLYAGKNMLIGATLDSYALGFSRQALHAYKLSFTDREGEKVHYETPLPPDFEKALNE